MKELFFVAAGGSIGAVLRYIISTSLYSSLGKFLYVTMGINVLGSFLIGITFILINEKMTLSSEYRGFIIVGLLGAFTTFSTFSLETVLLIQNGLFFKALINIFLSVVLCILATWLGIYFARGF